MSKVQPISKPRSAAKPAKGNAAAGDSRGPGAVPPPTAAAGTAAPQPKSMMLVVRPNVRDRWLASQLSYFTPQIVENTVRGAMAGNLLAQWLMFDLMEQTWPRLNKNLNELKNAVIDLDWNLQPFALRGDKPSAEATRRRKVIEQALWLMRPEADADEADFEDTIYDVLDAVGKGIAVSEIDWMAPGDPDNQTGLWMPRATKWVHPRYYGYPPQPGAEDRLMLNMMEVRLNNPDADAALEEAFQRSTSEVFGGLPQSGNNSLYARFPRDQFIISIIKQKSGHPISSALLRILGFWWAASNFSWEWFLNLAQIFGVPLRWANYDSKAPPDTISGIKDMMANLGSAGWAVFPEGVKINIEKALEAARDNPNKAFIDAADIIADTLILGQTLTTSQGERGSQALGTIHKDVRDEKIHAVAKRAAKILNNQFLPSICRMNFGDARECPWFQPSSKQAKDVVGQATRYKTLLSIPGIRVSEDQFYEDNDLVRPDPDDPVFVGQATGGFDNSSGGDGSEGDMPGDKSATAQGKSAATDKLIDQALENLTGVEAKWLAGVKPFFRELMAKAKDAELSDADFAKALVKARSQIPELFGKLDTKALAKAMEETMASAVVNGALKGHMARGGKK